MHRDYQGTILAISNEQGQTIERRLFDPWGKIIKVTDKNGNTQSVNPQFTFIDRGYTGHEHFFTVGLIHMNGRMYDPVLKQFLSPDNNIQEPFNSQNYNRYGYVLNNPLMYTDPSGEIFGLGTILSGAIIGAFIGGATYTVYALYTDTFSWNGFAKSVLIGGGTGAALGAIDKLFNVAGAVSTTGKDPSIINSALKKAGKAMLKKYISGVQNKFIEEGKLDFSFDVNELIKKGIDYLTIYDGIKNEEGSVETIKNIQKKGLLNQVPKFASAAKNILSSTMTTISSNIIDNKGVFEDMKFMSLGNGLISVGTNPVVKINYSKFLDHGVGLGDHFIYKKSMSFDPWSGCNFTYSKGLLSSIKTLKVLKNGDPNIVRPSLIIGGGVIGGLGLIHYLGKNNAYDFKNIVGGFLGGGIVGSIAGDFYYQNFIKK